MDPISQTSDSQKKFGKIFFKDFNFINAKEKYMINFVSSHGVFTKSYQCKRVFKTFPHANLYELAENKEGPFGKPGGIKIMGDGEKNRFIINIFGQKYDKSQNMKEPFERKIRYFTSALYKVFRIKDLESVALHQFVGCDEWGSFWNKYSDIINKFAVKYPHIQTVVYSINSGNNIMKQAKKAVKSTVQNKSLNSQQKFQNYSNKNPFTNSSNSKSMFRSSNRGK